MYFGKFILTVICTCFATFIAFGQTEGMKDVMNNISFYYKKNDLKYLGDAKKTIDASFKTHDDSVDVSKKVFKAVVYTSIVYIDSLNKLGLPDTLLQQATRMVNELIKNRKANHLTRELTYAKGCLANVYLRKAYTEYGRNNLRLAINNFNLVKFYVPASKQPDLYLAHIYSKLGNYKKSEMFYDSLMVAPKPAEPVLDAAINVYKTLGDTLKVLRTIQKGLDLYPQNKILLIEKANIFYNQKKFNLLKPLLDDLLNSSGTDLNLVFLCADCYDHLNEFEKAEELYQRAYELNTFDYNPVFNLGLLYLKKAALVNGKPDFQANLSLSKNWLEKAYEISPYNEACLKTLQMLYLQTGENDRLNQINNELKHLNNL